jgi:hypothetical protein
MATSLARPENNLPGGARIQNHSAQAFAGITHDVPERTDAAGLPLPRSARVTAGANCSDIAGQRAQRRTAGNSCRARVAGSGHRRAPTSPQVATG